MIGWANDLVYMVYIYIPLITDFIHHFPYLVFYLTLFLPVTRKCINFSTVYNDTLVAKGLNHFYYQQKIPYPSKNTYWCEFSSKINQRYGRLLLNSIKYRDLPGSIHEDTVMDGHRQGKKANAYKYPLTFLK